MPSVNSSHHQPVVAVAGSAAMDMTLRNPPRNWIDTTGREIYTQTTLRRLDSAPDMVLGGNGAASAYVMAKLGLRAKLNAPIGQDAAGRLVREWLHDAGVDVIAPTGGTTNVAVTAVDAHGLRLGTLQYPGPPIEWQRTADIPHAFWMLLAGYGSARDEELDEIASTFAAFDRPGGTAVFDSGVAWMPSVEPARMHGLWSHIDLLIGTVEELAHWSGEQSPRTIAQFVLAHGPRQVVIKMGGQGAAWQQDGDVFGHQAAQPIEKPDLTIGAGDAFNAALIVSLARDSSLADAVQHGQQVAAKVVQTGRGVLGWDTQNP